MSEWDESASPVGAQSKVDPQLWSLPTRPSLDPVGAGVIATAIIPVYLIFVEEEPRRQLLQVWLSRAENGTVALFVDARIIAVHISAQQLGCTVGSRCGYCTVARGLA